MSDLTDPEKPPHAIVKVLTDGRARRNDGTELKAVCRNPWYVLATVHGEQGEDFDKNLHARNRRIWNGWMCQEMAQVARAELAERLGVDVRELAPLAEVEEAHLRQVFANRLPNGTPPDPADPVAFSSRYFALRASFDGFHFPTSALFRSAAFGGDADFASASFGTDVSFASAHFCGGAFFRSASFGGDVDFTFATFDDDAWFAETRFRAIAGFLSVSFLEDADFGSATFGGDTWFLSASFRKHANFASASFGDDAWFRSAAFERRASFRSASFAKGAEFNSASFGKDAGFESASFGGNSNFESAVFSANAHFGSATFDGFVRFVSTSFEGDAVFDSVRFDGNAWFQKAAFGDLSVFDSVHFDWTADFSDGAFAAKTLFRNAVFARRAPEFYQRDVHQNTVFTLRPENWPAITEKNADDSLRAYARLRHVMNELQKPDEEHFFFRQEMRCKALTEDAPNNWLIAAFGVLADYGISVTRPVAWLAALWAVAAYAYAAHVLPGCFAGLSDGLPEGAAGCAGGRGAALAHGAGLSFSSLFGFLGFSRLYFWEVLQALPAPLKVLAGFQTLAGVVLLFFLGLGLRTRFRLK